MTTVLNSEKLLILGVTIVVLIYYMSALFLSTVECMYYWLS